MLTKPKHCHTEMRCTDAEARQPRGRVLECGMLHISSHSDDGCYPAAPPRSLTQISPSASRSMHASRLWKYTAQAPFSQRKGCVSVAESQARHVLPARARRVSASACLAVVSRTTLAAIPGSLRRPRRGAAVRRTCCGGRQAMIQQCVLGKGEPELFIAGQCRADAANTTLHRCRPLHAWTCG